jgi:hypothetical protein
LADGCFLCVCTHPQLPRLIRQENSSRHSIEESGRFMHNLWFWD